MKILNFIFYQLVKSFSRLVICTLCRVKFEGCKNIPKNGGLLVVGNHSSWIDTLLLAMAMNRSILWFVTGDFILDVPIMKNIVNHLFIIPMRRKHGKEAIEKVVKQLKTGSAVCIFPEGELTYTGNVERFRNGVSVIQKEAQVPIVPFYIKGAFDVWSRKECTPKLFRNITVSFGELFYPEQEDDKVMANKIREKVLAVAGE